MFIDTQSKRFLVNYSEVFSSDHWNSLGPSQTHIVLSMLSGP